MPPKMTTLQDLVAAFRAGRMKLPALFDALGERGASTDEQYALDVAWLQRQRDENDLDPLIAKALLAKLASLRNDASGPSEAVTPVDDDATRVYVAGTGDNPAGQAEEEDITRVRPASPPQAVGDESTTVVQPPSRPGAAGGHTQGTTGGTSSSLNVSTWKRMAGEAGGEFATVGMLLKGRFLLEREIGRGGMGVVYLARDERKVEARDRDPYVAVKVLNDEFRRHPDSLIALQRESRRSQKLAHDNIVRVYDFDKDRTIVFMTMEYIDGTNLKTLIREEAYDGMPLAKARPLIEGMALALKRAHAAGVVHSDFKPGNVMVTREGVPKVFDFGIARAGKYLGEAPGEAAGEETVFDAGTLGALTPAYASLEMLRGAEPTPADDIYALGCVAYELLTGKHPFDKLSAESALKEDRLPPHIPGLTKRQNRTLAGAVAFHGEQRLHSVMELVDGLREVSWRERARPLLIYGVIALVVIVLGSWGISRYVDARHVSQVVNRFELDNPHHYANEDQAFKALEGLGVDNSKRVVVDHSDAIEGYLLSRLNAYWDPAHGRYNYAGVQHVFQVRNRLKLFSPQLDIRRSAIQQQRNTLLNKLDTQLSQRIGTGAIFADQPKNVVDTLDKIRAIDPHSELLHNTELELKYDIAISQSLDAGHVERAKRQLALATRLFPQSKRLQQRGVQLTALEQAASAAAKVANVRQSAPEARKTLAQLIARPSLAPEWRTAVSGALEALHADHSPATQQLIQSLVDAIATQAAGAKTRGQVRQADALVALALAQAPKSQKLLVQRERLDALQQKMQAQLAVESAAAEVTSRIGSMKRAVAAHDIDKAAAALARIRALQPDNAFLTRQAPQLMAQAYLGQAESLMLRGHYQRAADTLAQGLKALGNRTDLRNARARDMFVAGLMQARQQPPDAAGIGHLRSELKSLTSADADGLDALQKALKLRGALPQGSFAAEIDALKPVATVAVKKPPPSAPVANVPKAPVARPEPAPSPPAAAVKPVESPSAVAPTAPPDPCARSGLTGRGRTCADNVDGTRGPALVVIPGIDGGKPYAMSRTEITVREFDRFCNATHQCAAKGGSSSLPISDISLAQARAYAAWLTKLTGYTYRLPTNAEWVHAARAGQAWMQSPDSNCIPPGGDYGSGGAISARGRAPNPWGLVNMSGNMWEWVTQGDKVMVRGGSYDSYWSDCTVASHRNDSGKPQKDVGFRVLRALR